MIIKTKKFDKKMDLSFLMFRFDEYPKFVKKEYPYFHSWFNKISNETGTKKRPIYLIYEYPNSEKEVSKKKIIGIMILKNDIKEKKICSIYINEKYRNKGLGKELFNIAFKELNTQYPVISIPKSNYKNEIKHLLEKYNFRLTSKKNKEYFFNEEVKILISIKEKYANKIFNGSKKYELRKNIWKFGSKNKVIVYASGSLKKIIGEFETNEFVKGTPQEIWSKYKDDLGIIEKEYFEYFKNKNIAYAIKINNYKKYKEAISLNEIIETKPPQSYIYLKGKE